MKKTNRFIIGLLAFIMVLMTLGGFAQTKVVYVQLVDTMVTKATYRESVVRKIGAADVNFYGVADCLDNRAQSAGLAQLLLLYHTVNPTRKAICVFAQKTDNGFNSAIAFQRGYNITHTGTMAFDSYNLEYEVWNPKNGITWAQFYYRLKLIKETFGKVEVYWGKFTTQGQMDTLATMCDRILFSYYFDCSGITTLSQFAAKCKSLDNGRIEAIKNRVTVIALFNTKPEFCGAFISNKGIANCFNQLAKLMPNKFSGYANYILKI